MSRRADTSDRVACFDASARHSWTTVSGPNGIQGAILFWFVAWILLTSRTGYSQDGPNDWSPYRPQRSISTDNVSSAENEQDSVRMAEQTGWKRFSFGLEELPEIVPEAIRSKLAPSTGVPEGANSKPPTDDERHVIPFHVRNSDIDVKNVGGRVSLVARDAPLRELLSVLARSQKLNLVFAGAAPSGAGGQGATPSASAGGGAASAASRFASALTGGGQGAAGRTAGAGASSGVGAANSRVTVALEDVPLDTALDTILSVTGYTWTRSQGIILVTPAVDGTRLPPNAQGREMQVFELDFAIAEDVNLAVQGLLSPVGQSFTTSSSADDNRRSREIVVVEDLPRYVDRIAQYIAQLDKPPRQVEIQAYVLEVDLNANNRHGVDLEDIARAVDPSIRLGTRGLASRGAGQTLFFELNGDRFGAFLDALRTTVDAKTLASPRIVALNGQRARLQVGEQLGFRITTTTQTSTLESVEFLNVGVVLSVTPRISRDGQVMLHVQPEVSTGNVNPDTGLPEEDTAELETNVLLDNGQGIVVGGLIREDFQNSQSKVPVIGDVPYLGALFERREDRRSRSEIIVALIPRVLPLTNDWDEQQQIDYTRATTPLLKGALVENPRPFEPALRDPLRVPQRNWTHRNNMIDEHQAAVYGSVTGTRTDLQRANLRFAPPPVRDGPGYHRQSVPHSHMPHASHRPGARRSPTRWRR